MNNNFDFIVVGSGLAGASTAMHAARQGMSVLIIDRCALGGTSTQLSAGHVMTGFLPSPDEMKVLLGTEKTIALQNWSHASKLALRREALVRLGEGAIEDGYFFLGRGQEDYEVLQGIHRFWSKYLNIIGLRLQSKSERWPILSDSHFSCSLFDPTAYTIKPVYVRKLVKSMSNDYGISHLLNTEVISVRESSNGDVELKTNSDVICTKRIAICSGSQTPAIVSCTPIVIRDTSVFGDFIVTGLNKYNSTCTAISASDCSHDPIYFTIRGKETIHFGAPTETTDISVARAVLLAKFRDTFPKLEIKGLRNVRIAAVDRTENGLPVIGLVSPRIAVAYGFSGVGLATSFGAGRAIVESFTSQAQFLTLQI